MRMVTSSFRGNVAGTPSNVQEGDYWFDTTDKQYKGYQNGKVVIQG